MISAAHAILRATITLRNKREMTQTKLPIEAVLPDLKQQLRNHPQLILQAPPGAGKTTRVPLALLDEDWLAGRLILMLEPRRLAASNAARYMAGQLGESVGQRVGFSIRYQRKVSRQTRIEVVTEGILTRRLQNDPELPGVGLVIFDEFHERHLQSDLALALCRDVQQGFREDLKLLVMSATLDSEPLAKLLSAPIITSQGRAYPVEVCHLPQAPRQRLVDSVVAGVRRAVRETDGDILCFLPGEGEIRRCAAELKELAGELLICPLYGNLPFAEQERAIRPAGRRKLVLATNIAETSLTIEGIRSVIDSGYCRQPRFDAGSGLTRLELSRISRASATQRAGRAGRLGPGRCYRLWSEGVQGELLPFTPPEIRSADLAPLALELLNWGISDPLQLSWLDPPPPAAWQAGLELLQTLGALNAQQQLTTRGKALAQLPAHPRLGCLLLAAQQQKLLPLACDLLGLLAERGPWHSRQTAPQRSDCDIHDRLEELWKRRRQQRLGEFSGADRSSRYWQTYFKLPQLNETTAAYSHLQAAELLAAAYPDRIARARTPGGRRYLLSSGQGATLDERSAVQQADYLLAVELRGGQQAEAQISLASRLTPQRLQELCPNLPWQPVCRWDSGEGRVIDCEQQRLGALVLAERPGQADSELRQAALLAGIRSEGLKLFKHSPAVKSLLARGAFLQRSFPDQNWPDCSDAALLASLDDWLLPFLGSARNRADLQKLDLLPALRARFDWQQLQQLDLYAPERLKVPSGSQIRLDYSTEGPPVLAVKLQEMFGQIDTPRVADGRVAVLIHLLSPAGRPLQITQDLRHFWQENYPEVQKEMKGRYPKHPWPDNPLAFQATAKTKRKLAQQEQSR